MFFFFFFFNDTATTEIYTLSLHDALPISGVAQRTGATTYYVEIFPVPLSELGGRRPEKSRSEEHTSELQSPDHLVCRLLLEKKKTKIKKVKNQEKDDRNSKTIVLSENL